MSFTNRALLETRNERMSGGSGFGHGVEGVGGGEARGHGYIIFPYRNMSVRLFWASRTGNSLVNRRAASLTAEFLRGG